MLRMATKVARIDGSADLTKVLWYYNLLPSVNVASQKIVCPFHDDENPSLLVNLEEDNWYCFGCGLSGDAFKFVKLYESRYNKRVSDLEAYVKYRGILKSDKCSSIKPVVRQAKRSKTSKELYDEAYDYYHGLSRVNWLSDETPEVVEARLYMNKRGFSDKTLIKCDTRVTYNNNYGLIFPMLDNGIFKGWVCRTMLPSVEKRRKYLYNKGFSRATTLVGDYGSKDYVFVVEGYMDWLKFVQNGIDNVVAILGWKMTAQQIDKLHEAGVTKVISALDNDEYGRRGTRYLEHFFEVTRFSYLKGIKDPGEMIAKDFEKMYNRTIAKFRLKGTKR